MNTNHQKLTTWDRIMMAITFAEAGEPTTALNFLNRKQTESRVDKRTEKRPEIRL